MIVDAAHMSDLPADGHHFKELALVNQVSRVMALGIKKVRSQRLRLNPPRPRELQDARNGEVVFWDGAELFHPFINRHVFHSRRGFHCCSSELSAKNDSKHRIISRPDEPGGRNCLRSRRVMMEFKMSSQASDHYMNLLGKSAEELRAFLQSLGEPAYRGAQIYHALYAE